MHVSPCTNRDISPQDLYKMTLSRIEEEHIKLGSFLTYSRLRSSFGRNWISPSTSFSSNLCSLYRKGKEQVPIRSLSDYWPHG